MLRPKKTKFHRKLGVFNLNFRLQTLTHTVIHKPQINLYVTLTFIPLITSFFLFQVVKIVPNDKDARLKLEECEKTVKRMAFEAAISAEQDSAFKTLDVESFGM